jgi:hypothetical protein
MILTRIFYFSFFPFILILTLGTMRHTNDDFNWQTLESGMLKVHWYEGDTDFGQDALATAQAGLEAIGGLIPSSLEQPIEIFIYANANDFHDALVTGKENWVAGHAEPELGLVRVLIEPGPQQGIVMEQRIPHELMHVMLYRHVGSGYHNIPVWLREGMATLVEIYSNAEYDRVLAEAVSSNKVIPLKDLCTSFPADAGQAFLAYAEARSFTAYLHKMYSSTGLLNLVRSHADGLDCERGPERVFGIPLSDLESQWRSAVLGQKTVLFVMQNIAPYLVLLCLVLIIPMLGILGTLRKRKLQ